MTDKTDTTVKISPAAGVRVRHEGGELLEPKTDVAWSPYWQRRSDDGEITVHASKEQKD